MASADLRAEHSRELIMDSLVDLLQEIMSEVSWNSEIQFKGGKWVGLLPETERRIRELVTAVVHATLGVYDDFLAALGEAHKSDASCVTRVITRSVWDLPMAPNAAEVQALVNQVMSERNAIRALREKAGETPDLRNPWGT